MLLRSLAIIAAISPVACMKIDWQYSDHRSSGDSAKEGAAELAKDEGLLLVDLPESVVIGSDKITVKIWPADDCEGTKEESALAAADFPHTVIVDTTCDYKISFALGAASAGESIDVLADDLVDGGSDGLVVDVKLAASAATATSTATDTATASDAATDTTTSTVTDAATSTDPNVGQLGIKEFRIPAGTGRGAWNTEATAIVARIGDTVRIFNDDTVEHRLHTDGGRPCSHGNPIAPGQSGDCRITSQFVGQTYDHNTNGAVFFQATR